MGDGHVSASSPRYEYTQKIGDTPQNCFQMLEFGGLPEGSSSSNAGANRFGALCWVSTPSKHGTGQAELFRR